MSSTLIKVMLFIPGHLISLYGGTLSHTDSRFLDTCTKEIAVSWGKYNCVFRMVAVIYQYQGGYVADWEMFSTIT